MNEPHLPEPSRVCFEQVLARDVADLPRLEGVEVEGVSDRHVHRFFWHGRMLWRVAEASGRRVARSLDDSETRYTSPLMVLFNHATREMTAKIVYYGPGLCGKTTNLMVIFDKLDPASKGKMLSL